jgi:hypothetical protein
MILLTLVETYITLPRFLSHLMSDLTKHTVKRLEFGKIASPTLLFSTNFSSYIHKLPQVASNLVYFNNTILNMNFIYKL